MITQVFRRTEIKYVLTPEQYADLMEIIEPYLEKDKYFKGTNCSVYFDTAGRYLAIHSLESPLYKEKVRVRSYGVPSLDDTVFLELKKKFNGVGGKRRIPIRLADFYKYLKDRRHFPDTGNPQIEAELDYAFKHYDLRPALFIAYDRTSYIDKDDPTFRITFDQSVRSREDDLGLELGDHGQNYFDHGEIVMEVKAVKSYPLWFTRALSRLKIYPAKFSKYGRVMQKLTRKENINV